ncbi:tail fiber protein, partial [Photorhabdus hainanensis]|uniref:tail fiber protein n=1 Tax=Photorhabdus hainanensis TaxID=1004166 RepID=UPI001BD4F3AD
VETVNKANNAVPSSRKINGKALSGDVSLNAGDVGAISSNQLGEIVNGGKFKNYLSTGFYRVAVPNPSSVSDFPCDGNMYGYGILDVQNANGVILQRYISHHGDIATRQTWGGPEQYLPWTIQYSTQNKPTAEDVGALSGKQYISSLTVQTSAWVKIAEVTMKVMSTININIVGGSGYNVGNFEQCAITNIVLRTGNGYPHGINAVMYTVNTTAPTDLATVNTSGDNYDIYIFIGPFAQNIILNAFMSDNATVNQLLKIAELSEVPKGAVKGKVYSYLLSGRERDIYPVGAPIPWPLPNVPAGYLACNGQAFNKSLYPQLAMAYPSGALPDLRGEFIRGWDDGRGVDHGRGVLSWQADEFKSHSHTLNGDDAGSSGNRVGRGNRNPRGLGPTNETGGNETRPRNVAFNYIVRAA